MYLYLAIFRLYYPYLGIFALNSPNFTICAIFTLYMHSSIETALPCKILQHSDHLIFMEILHFKYLGDTNVLSECSLGVNLVIAIFCM